MKLNKMGLDDKKIDEAARGAADLYEQDLPMMSYDEDTEVDGQHHFCQEFVHRLEICWNVLTHKTFIAYTTDDIDDKWSLIYNIESLEQFGQWLVSGGYKENSNYKK